MELNNRNGGQANPTTIPTPARRPLRKLLLIISLTYLIFYFAYQLISAFNLFFPSLLYRFPGDPNTTLLIETSQEIAIFPFTEFRNRGLTFEAKDQRAFTSTEGVNAIKILYQRQVGIGNLKLGSGTAIVNQTESLEVLYFEGKSGWAYIPTNAVVILDYNVPAQNNIIRTTFPQVPAYTNVVIIFRGNTHDEQTRPQLFQF